MLQGHADFRESFQKELNAVKDEKAYKERVIGLLKQYYYNLDLTDINVFFNEEVKKLGWEPFSYLFIRKAVDMAMDQGGNEKEACSKLLYMCTHDFGFVQMDFAYAFDFLLWNGYEYQVDIPQYFKILAKFIARATFDGTITYKYIICAEVFHYEGSILEQEEETLQMVVNLLQVKPLEYSMKNVWDPALTNEELILKFKSLIGDYLQNQDLEYFGSYLTELKCIYFYHELVKRIILMAIEKDQDAIESALKLLQFLNAKFLLSEE
mmetsp:Transcript_23759/g.23447  ORF Transcript_23759/g.23447 Transcript_23759/m.23447 type:complete len:266 (+) Transcript_23759:710-1507(+)